MGSAKSTRGAMQKSSSDSGLSFLANSKVGSATGFMVVAGNIMALPHPHRKTQTFPNRFTASSTHNESFKEVPHCFASMGRKPLTAYDANAPRSRLAQED